MILTMAIVAVLSITPTKGKAPFKPEISAVVDSNFKGKACLRLEVTDTFSNLGFCQEAKPEMKWEKVTDDLWRGKHALTLYLIPFDTGRPIRMNTVSFEVQ